MRRGKYACMHACKEAMAIYADLTRDILAGLSSLRSA
jgi:hypothetical protein